MGLGARMIGMIFLMAGTAFAAGPIHIQVVHGTPREVREKSELSSLLKKDDLTKYTFTDQVVIEQGVMNHSFPVITLNVASVNSPDALLGTYIHEQLHWNLRQHNAQRMEAIRRLS